MQTLNAVRLAQQLVLPRLAQAQCIVDATAGNGNDTLFLAKHSESKACIYAFDVQESAIAATRQRLMEHQATEKVKLILDSHANVRHYIKGTIDVAMFNLGYLPGQCHETMTRVESTLQALTTIVAQLTVGGIISIIAYPGHHHGQDENDAVRSYIKILPLTMFTVVCLDMINHGPKAPVLYLIEKVRATL